MKPIIYYALLAVVVSGVLIAGLVTLTEEAYAIGYCHTICPRQCADWPDCGPHPWTYCLIYPNGPTITCQVWCCEIRPE